MQVIPKHAFIFLKLTHALLHTFTLWQVIDLAHSYFKKHTTYIQLLAFILLSNHNLRLLETEMFNDSFMVVYLLMAIRSMAKNQPLKAGGFMSMAIGVKSGAILMAPALLGWLHYAHGTVGLFASLFVVFAVQVALASPFVSTPVADWLEIKNGAQTTFSDYVKYSKMFGADPVTGSRYGALHHHSMYWQWITQQSYTHPAFCNGVLVLLLG